MPYSTLLVAFASSNPGVVFHFIFLCAETDTSFTFLGRDFDVYFQGEDIYKYNDGL